MMNAYEILRESLITGDSVTNLKRLEKTGFFKQFPNIQNLVDFDKDQGKWHDKSAWEHSLGVVDHVPNELHLKFAALFHDIGKPYTYSIKDGNIHFYGHPAKSAKIWIEFAHKYGLYPTFEDKVAVLVFEHMTPTLLMNSGVKEKGIKRFINRVNAKYDLLDDLFVLSYADHMAHNVKMIEPKLESFYKFKKRVYETKARMENESK